MESVVVSVRGTLSIKVHEKTAIPGQLVAIAVLSLLTLLSSECVFMTCLAHHPALDTHGESVTSVPLMYTSMHMYMYMYVSNQTFAGLPRNFHPFPSLFIIVTCELPRDVFLQDTLTNMSYSMQYVEIDGVNETYVHKVHVCVR